MDQAHGPSALACEDERVIFALFGAPAESAVNLVSLTKTLLKFSLPEVVRSFHGLSFF
jgi:hypothetical protein